MRKLAVAIAVLLLMTSCSADSQPGPPSTIVTPTTMIHHSSMGELESDWSISEIPEEFRGDWRLQSLTDAPLASEFGPGYSSLLFRLTQSPADCRVLLDEPSGPREIGTMPYVSLSGGELVATFTGDFHLTYTLNVRHRANGDVVGEFDHSGSGVVYFEGKVRLVAP